MKGVMTSFDLQNAINQWAYIGWELDRITSGETRDYIGGKDVFLLIFKRRFEIPEGFYLIVNNEPAGPLNDFDVSNMIQNKLLAPDMLACKKGLDGWHPLNVVAPDLVAGIFA
jgi:GYF domain 2